MTLDSDILIDRRRLKRRLSFWRVLGVCSIVAVMAVAIASNNKTSSAIGLTGSQIARVTVSGFIGDNHARHELFDKLKKEDNVKAVIIAVDSPGGSTSGGEALYNDIRDLASAKPVAAVFGTAATSAAYLAGIATDYIVARGNTITGSVGVIFQWAEATDLLGKLGLKVEEIRSGPLKAKPSPFSPTDEDARRVSEELVKESQGWFNGLVQERRKNVATSMDDIKTGRIYTGRQAIKIGLVDAIGDEETAIHWFTDTRHIEEGLKVIDRKPEADEAAGLFSTAAIDRVSSQLGLSSSVFSTLLNEFSAVKDHPVDGLLSIWHAK